MTDICSVTVWFNPDSSAVQNLLSYSSAMKTAYIIDNSDSDNSGLCSEIANAVYLPNFTNMGIAAGLNKGCERAFSDGNILCMTMDMDSSFEVAELKAYLSFARENFSETNVSFCPLAVYEKPRSVLGSIKHALLRENNTINMTGGGGSMSINRCITSGNIISLAAWKEVGCFYEPFFIDEVDYEFCYKLKEAGYTILLNRDVQMNHVLGNPRRTFYPCSSYHSGERLYYIFRNLIFNQQLHPEYCRRLNYRKKILHRIKEVLFNLRFSQIPWLVRGWKDARRGRLGKYEGRK